MRTTRFDLYSLFMDLSLLTDSDTAPDPHSEDDNSASSAHSEDENDIDLASGSGTIIDDMDDEDLGHPTATTAGHPTPNANGVYLLLFRRLANGVQLVRCPFPTCPHYNPNTWHYRMRLASHVRNDHLVPCRSTDAEEFEEV